MFQHRRTRRVRLAVCAAASASLIATGAAIAVPAQATTPPASASDPATLVYVYTVTPDSPATDAGQLATALVEAGFDVATRAGADISVLGSASDRAVLDAFPGAAVTGTRAIDAHPAVAPAPASQDAILPSRLDGLDYDTFYGGYRTVDAYHEFVADLAAAYPDLVKVYDYGTSYTGDNPLQVVCITEDAPNGCALNPETDKARVMLSAQVHAREITTSEMMWRFMTYLTDKDGKNAEVTALLQNTEYWIVPHTNPDGVEVVQAGIEDDGLGYDSPAWQRKNMNPGSQQCGGPWAFSQRGVDINRNHDSHWGGPGSSGDQCDQTYRGTSAASEPETQGLQTLYTSIFRDQRGSGADDPAPDDTTGIAMALHTYGNLMLMPWGWTLQHAPNDAGLRSTAFRLSNFNGFETGQDQEVLYATSGTTEDWTYDALGIPSFIMETGSDGGACGGFHPPYTCQDGFFAENLPVFLYMGAAASAPYELSQGPTTLSAKAKLKKGTKIKLKGIADDDAYGHSGVGRPASQNVTAARVYIGTAPWDGGTPTDLKVKGSGKSVKVKGKFAAPDTKVLGYVQARDADGNWGPIRAVWIKAKK